MERPGDELINQFGVDFTDLGFTWNKSRINDTILEHYSYENRFYQSVYYSYSNMWFYDAFIVGHGKYFFDAPKEFFLDFFKKNHPQELDELYYQNRLFPDLAFKLGKTKLELSFIKWHETGEI